MANSRLRIEPLLASYPRLRPALSGAWEREYVATYKQSREGRGLLFALSQKLESWMHHQVARRSEPDGPVLEVGAGSLNHLPYERARPYDIVEPFTALYEAKPQLKEVRHAYADIREVPVEARYRRILSIASLEHVTDLPDCLARAGMLLAPGGLLQAGIPSEGGFLWGFSWRLSVGLSCRLRTGLDYGDLMRHEHINEAHEIVALLHYFYGRVRIRRFPLPLHHGSLYAYLEASEPRLDLCRAHSRQPGGVHGS
jgi:hypothetical protein